MPPHDGASAQEHPDASALGEQQQQHQQQQQPPPSQHYRQGALVVGNYCHDRIRLPSGAEASVLGGSVSYIGNVLDALGLPCHVVSKVGPDFAYAAAVPSHPPLIVPGHSTTQFFADLHHRGSNGTTGGGGDRTLTAGNICQEIFPADIPDTCGYQIALAVGVAGEIRPDTLARMAATSGCVVADVQALIRTIDPVTGAVALRRLRDTPFQGLLDRIAFLKASSSEAAYIDLEDARKRTCVIVTEGRDGCRVYADRVEFVVPAFAAEEVDPTGAGDSFLAGFCAGLLNGLPVYKAVLMGNYFGALAVGQVGVPHFSPSQIQGWGCNTLVPLSAAVAADGYHDSGLVQGVCQLLEMDHAWGIDNRLNHCMRAGSVCSQ